MLRLLAVLAALAVALGCAGRGAPPSGTPATSAASEGAAPVAPSASATIPNAAASAAPSVAAAAEPQVVRLGIQSSASDGAIFIAMDQGYFAEAGITVENEQFASASDMVPALSTDQIDGGGLGSAAATYNAFARDVGIRLVADKGSTPPGAGYMALVVRKDHVEGGRFRDGADLRGMTVAVTPPRNGAANSVGVARLIEGAGVAPEEVSIANISFGDMPAALSGRSVDAAFMIEPLVTQAVRNSLGVRWRGNDEGHPNQQIGILSYSPGFMRDRPAVARAFMAAYLRGARDYHDAFFKRDAAKRALAIEVLTKYTSVKDAGLVEQMVPAGINPNGYLNTETMNYDQDWFIARGTQQRKVDLALLVDHSYVDHAIQQLGTYQ